MVTYRISAMLLVCVLGAGAANAEVQDCIPIAAVPAVITQQGVHCLKQDLSTPATTGTAITINAHNVIIDMNGFKLGGLGAGAGTTAYGIYAIDRQNITIRNGTVRGFFYNIYLNATGDGASNRGHVIEDLRIEGARFAGVFINGSNTIVRNNFVTDTGNSSINANATGISVSLGENHSVIDNTVSGVTATGIARGITVANTSAGLARGNQVRDINAPQSIGILEGGTRNTVQDNLVANAATGTKGIDAIGSDDACLDNVVANFTTPLAGCALNSGNRTF